MKYRVANMPTNAEGYKTGDIVEYPIEVATRLILRGYILPLYAAEPLPMDEAKSDKMVRHSRRKGV